MFRILTQKAIGRKPIGRKSAKRAQTAIEYLLLLGVATVIALVGFKTFLPRVYTHSEFYFNRSAVGILDEPPICGLVDAGRIIP